MDATKMLLSRNYNKKSRAKKKKVIEKMRLTLVTQLQRLNLIHEKLLAIHLYLSLVNDDSVFMRLVQLHIEELIIVLMNNGFMNNGTFSYCKYCTSLSVFTTAGETSETNVKSNSDERKIRNFESNLVRRMSINAKKLLMEATQLSMHEMKCKLGNKLKYNPAIGYLWFQEDEAREDWTSQSVRICQVRSFASPLLIEPKDVINNLIQVHLEAAFQSYSENEDILTKHSHCENPSEKNQIKAQRMKQRCLHCENYSKSVTKLYKISEKDNFHRVTSSCNHPYQKYGVMLNFGESTWSREEAELYVSCCDKSVMIKEKLPELVVFHYFVLAQINYWDGYSTCQLGSTDCFRGAVSFQDLEGVTYCIGTEKILGLSSGINLENLGLVYDYKTIPNYNFYCQLLEKELIQRSRNFDVIANTGTYVNLVNPY